MDALRCDYQREEGIQESSEGRKTLLSKSVKKELQVKVVSPKGRMLLLNVIKSPINSCIHGFSATGF